MTNSATRPTRTCLRGSRAVAAVSAIAPTATLSAYPEISRPAAASDTAKLDATCGSSPAIRNSVRPMPKPPTCQRDKSHLASATVRSPGYARQSSRSTLMDRPSRLDRASVHGQSNDDAWTKAGPMFTVEERDRLRERLLARAEADDSVVGAAFTGSYAVGEGDRWSSTDLVLAVRGDLTPTLERWTGWLYDDLGARHHWDLRVGAGVIRVFLLPDWLEIDLTFARRPSSANGARSGGRSSAGPAPSNPSLPRTATPWSASCGITPSTRAVRRAGPLVAGRALDQRPARARDHPGLSATRPSGRAREGRPPAPRRPLDRAGDDLVRSLTAAELHRALEPRSASSPPSSNASVPNSPPVWPRCSPS